MSEGAEQPSGAFGQPTRSPVGSPAGSAPAGATSDRLFSSRPPSVGWTPAAEAMPPAPEAAPGAGPSGDIDIATWLKLSGEDDAPPPRPTWTLSTGQFPVVGTGQFTVLPEGRPPAPGAGLDTLIDAGNRFRTLLGLVMALLLTGAIVIAFHGSKEQQLSQAPAAGAPGRPATTSGLLTSQPDGRIVVVPAGPVATGGSPAGANPTDPAATPVVTTPDGSTVLDPTAVPATTPDGSIVPASATAPVGSAAGAPTSAAAPAEPTVASTPGTVGAPGPGPGTTAVPGPGAPPPGRPARVNFTKEAETLEMLGDAVPASDHVGYSGSGFVSRIFSVGSGIRWNLENTGPAGNAVIHIRFATGGETPPSRSLTIVLNGEVFRVWNPPRTGSWDTWQTDDLRVPLRPGRNTLSLVVGANDKGFVAIDTISVLPTAS